ncbi:hypothetical protein Glove_131g75 [Diversispora epigaea]|uniref:Uncharacterized protein n=1 Tax=Diversispora epigaea TaxID=1348612 RepID=A0A397J6P3_9GLOM|nr:hypothetical protein Glove_131g75 [Diversispora epigaea]
MILRASIVPTHSDIISKCNNGLTAILQRNLSDKQPMRFMPNDVRDAIEYINGISTYILRIYDTLINGQKVRVDITSIKPFFDIVVPGRKQLTIFKSNLVKIISKTLKGTSKFRIKIVDAFPVCGYHTEEKQYIRVTTWNQYDQFNTLKTVRDANLETASNDLNKQYYYQKIACKKRLPLSN